MSNKGKQYFKWSLIILLSVQFIGMAYAKIAGEMCDLFLSNGMSLEFMFFVGFMEVMATIGLFTPKWRIKSSAVLSVIMCGAIYIHLQSFEALQILLNVSNIGFLAIVVWLEMEKRMFGEELMRPSKY